MARLIHSRLKVEGTLTTETALHVGGLGESPDTDMPLARNGKGEYYIPGTSLTGSLRSWFEKNFPKETNALWGYQDGDKGHASFVLIEDMTLPKQVQSELRDGVGIDRRYGTAADKAKFDRAILPKGTKLGFNITVEIEKKNEAKGIKAMFGHLLEALRTGAIRLGASKTRGLGKVKLELGSINEYRLDALDDILNLVQNKSSKSYGIEELKDEDAGVKPSDSQLLTITIKWQPKSALMVKASYEGIGVDMLPLVSGIGNDKVSLLLPGSSIKGAFRAHAERIVRTTSRSFLQRNFKHFSLPLRSTAASKLPGGANRFDWTRCGTILAHGRRLGSRRSKPASSRLMLKESSISRRFSLPRLASSVSSSCFCSSPRLF
jgi:CRISPR/Cas system CSM-associated protein Csm3 (group 7 of RAMP superfamily)